MDADNPGRKRMRFLDLDCGLAMRRGLQVRPVTEKTQLASRSIPTSTARSARSSSQSISSSAKVRLCG